MPGPTNEPVLNYSPGSKETGELKSELSRLSSERVDIPVIVNGKEIRTGKTVDIHPPHYTAKTLGTYHQAGAKEIQDAIEGTQNIEHGLHFFRL